MAPTGYSSDYDTRTNIVTVFVTTERLNKMGGPYSEATSALVEDIVKREGYCKSGAFVRDRTSKSARGEFWQFRGSCAK